MTGLWWLVVGVVLLALAWLLGWEDRRRVRQSRDQFWARYGHLYGGTDTNAWPTKPPPDQGKQ